MNRLGPFQLSAVHYSPLIPRAFCERSTGGWAVPGARRAPGEQQPGDQQPGDQQPGDQQPGRAAAARALAANSGEVPRTLQPRQCMNKQLTNVYNN
jgi:hypothetical protein